MRFVAEPNLFGESSDAPAASTKEGGPRGKLVSPVKQAKRCVKLVSPMKRAERSVRQLGVMRYASKTASTFRSAVKSARSAFTSPTSATYQFFAI